MAKFMACAGCRSGWCQDTQTICVPDEQLAKEQNKQRIWQIKWAINDILTDRDNGFEPDWDEIEGLIEQLAEISPEQAEKEDRRVAREKWMQDRVLCELYMCEVVEVLQAMGLVAEYEAQYIPYDSNSFSDIDEWIDEEDLP